MSQYRLMRHLVAVAALGAFATVGCFVVDDTDDDDEGGGGEAGEESGGSGGSATGGKGGSATGGKGGSSTGGSSTGGSSTGGSSTGGSSTGGSSTGGSSTGGSGPGDGAVMKFCNLLAKGGVDAELTLTFAGVEATALTGTCTPVVPNACIPIPAVEGPEVSLVDPSDGAIVVEGAIPTLVVADGEEILVLATVDDVEMAPTVEAGQFLDTYVCADTDPFAEMVESRSTPFRLPAERNLRAQQNPAAARWTKKVVLAPGTGR